MFGVGSLVLDLVAHVGNLLNEFFFPHFHLLDLGVQLLVGCARSDLKCIGHKYVFIGAITLTTQGGLLPTD